MSLASITARRALNEAGYPPRRAVRAHWLLLGALLAVAVPLLMEVLS